MADRADHRVPSQQANPNHISANTCPHPPLRHSQGHVQHNPHVFGDDQQDVHREGVPQPAYVIMQGEMQYPPRINVPDYNMDYHPPPSPYPEIPYVHGHQDLDQDVGVAEAVPAQAHPFAPVCSSAFLLHVYIQPDHLAQNQEVQGNYDRPFGYVAQLRAADLPEAFPGVWPYPAPPANMPPADGLRNLAGRYLNNPDTRVNVLRIEPGPGGRFEVWIALELADIFQR
ncbi:hypothetical protein EDB89DRAFT_1951851 [Lactarius sanguifluus]|nr:hypothetical protein EDB89DRAFT_1951851 [Lactarius sanguifluus]